MDRFAGLRRRSNRGASRARKLSFWIERVNFVREYQKIDGFWLPQKDETFVQVRMYGEKVLTIDHHNYSISAAGSADESVQDAEN